MKRFIKLSIATLFVIILFPIYCMIGLLAEEAYVSEKYSEIEFGDVKNLRQVRAALSWFKEYDRNIETIPPSFLNDSDIQRALREGEVRFREYYFIVSGFVIVFDKNENKVTEIPSEI
jgi:hypothetical protein